MNGDYNCTLRPRVAVPVTGDAQCSDAPGKSSSPGTLRFLVFCEDQRYLKVRADMLQGFQFEVLRCSSFHAVVDVLQQNRGRFDILLSNGKVNGIDVSELLKSVSNDMDIMVVTMSGEDYAPITTFTCIFRGSSFSLNREGPIKGEVFWNIWQHRQHICGSGRGTSKDSAQIRNPNIYGSGRLQKPFEDSDHTSSKSKTKLKSWRNEEEENNGEHEASPPLKKQRVDWDGPLHQRFLEAVNQLGGIAKAVPNKILVLMEVPWLTRDHVASHLQKERLKQPRERETQERNGKSRELPGDENSRKINMARGQVTSSNRLPPPLPLLPPQPMLPQQPPQPQQSPMLQQPLSPQPDFPISFRSLIESEESAVGFHLWNRDLRGEPGNVGGMDFDVFQSWNTIHQHHHENTVSDLGMIADADIEAILDNPEWATMFLEEQLGRT